MNISVFSKSILPNFVPIPIQWTCTFYFKYTYSSFSIYFIFYSSMSLRDLFSLLSPSAFSNMQYPNCHHVLMQFWIMSHSFNLQLYQSLISILFLSSIFISSVFLSNFFQSQFVCSFNHHVFIDDLLGTFVPKICLLTCSLINSFLFPKFPVMHFLVWSF